MLKNMFKSFRDVKLAIPISILIFIVFWLTFNLLSKEFKQNSELNKLQKDILLTVKISKVIHEIQKERGMSAGFIVSKGTNFKKDLQIQRKLTDKKILAFETTHQGKSILKSIQNKIKHIRGSIDMLSLNTDDAISCYTNINNNLMDIIIDISKTSNSIDITQDLIAYSDFLYSKEYAGIERAIGTQIISSEHIAQNQINKFNALIVKQELFKQLFNKYASDRLKVRYKKFPVLEKMKETILSANLSDIKKIDVKDWFRESTIKIDSLKNIDNRLTQKILHIVKTKLIGSQQRLFIIIIANLFFIILFIFMLLKILSILKSEQKLRKLIDEHIIVSETDLKGIITDTSKAFCEISGYSRDELIGKSHNKVRHPDMPKEAFLDMWTTIQQDKLWSGNVKNLKKDGSHYWVHAVISPKYENGVKVGYTALRQDISDKIKIEELNKTLEEKISREVDKHRQKDQQLFQQSRLAQMGEMISMIAHQWRQPLSAISSTSGAINLKARLGKLDKETAHELSKDISEYAQHLSSTIDDFREFFKSNKDLKQTSYDELIKSVLKIIESSIKTQSIELILELDCNDKFKTYPNEIRQVILNLIKNAEDILIEKNISKPYIKIKTYKEDGKLILEVEDNGGGVPEDIKDVIFDPYFSTKTKKDGTGLGLYMSKTIIEEHCDGKLDLSNSSDGAVFKIILESENG